MTDARPSPDALLRAARREGRGRLKIFLGAAPGVGKTFEMLREAAERLRAGGDVVIAVVETHGRAETGALVAPFEIVPRRTVDYQGHTLGEMDLDAVLVRRPALALVDEFAHTNVPGSRHPKRWQDVAELLDAGIDVFTTLNVQHVESLNDVVASFTGIRVRETVPDSVFDEAAIEVVDLPPDELIERLRAGKVYVPAEATRALDRFFSRANLSALREMALRRAAQSVDRAMLDDLDAAAMGGTYAAGERILVAVSELPGSDGLVRAGKRLADALHAPWQAVFIETPRADAFGEAERRAIAHALDLAATLGATIVTIPAESVAQGLMAHIAAMRATQLVIGRAVRSRWFRLRHGSVVDRLLHESDGLAVHVIPAGAPARGAGAGVVRAGVIRVGDIRANWGSPAAYALVGALIAGTVLLGRAVEPLIGAGGIDLLFLLPVAAASGRFGFRPGLVASVAAGLAYNFFFLPPIYTFTIADPQSLLTQFVLIGVALFSATLTDRLRARAQIGVRGARENAAIAAFGQALARVSDWESTSRIVCEEMHGVLGQPVALLNRRDGVLAPVSVCPRDASPLTAVDHAAAEWAWSRGEAAGAGTHTLAAADWQFHPLKTSLGLLAVVAIGRDARGDPPGAQQAVLLATLLGQAALAHERLRLEDEVREAGVLRERDRLRAALLSSVGHDLRTPLTAATAAIDALAGGPAERPEIATARAEIDRLKRYLDNLLAMVRIDTDALSPAVEPIDLTDAIAAALDDLRALLAGNPVEVAIEPDLPLVPADPALLHHILINLLTNAAVHGGPGGRIAIAARASGQAVVLSVRDEGPGLPAGRPDEIFKAFARGAGSDRTGGSGLGLAIAKGFADAMGLGLEAGNAAGRGAQFGIRFEAMRRGDAVDHNADADS